MPKNSAFIDLITIALEPDSSVPLYQQLYETLREAILTGRLEAGLRLPPTRALAEELGMPEAKTIRQALAEAEARLAADPSTGSG